LKRERDPYGQVCDGHLHLSVEAFWATFRYHKWNDNQSRYSLESGYQPYEGDHSTWLTEDVPLDPFPDKDPILVAVIESRLKLNMAEPHGKPERCWSGIALRRSSKPSKPSKRKNVPVYERIGHVRGRSSDLPRDRKTLEVVIV
jgi:hypothetical protein